MKNGTTTKSRLAGKKHEIDPPQHMSFLITERKDLELREGKEKDQKSKLI